MNEIVKQIEELAKLFIQMQDKYANLINVVNQYIRAESDIQKDTEYLNSIPGMAESIIEGGNVPIEECIPEEDVDVIEERPEGDIDWDEDWDW